VLGDQSQPQGQQQIPTVRRVRYRSKQGVGANDRSRDISALARQGAQPVNMRIPAKCSQGVPPDGSAASTGSLPSGHGAVSSNAVGAPVAAAAEDDEPAATKLPRTSLSGANTSLVRRGLGTGSTCAPQAATSSEEEGTVCETSLDFSAGDRTRGAASSSIHVRTAPEGSPSPIDAGNGGDDDLSDIDMPFVESDDPQFVPEYIADVYARLTRDEVRVPLVHDEGAAGASRGHPRSRLSSTERAEMVDWLVGVHTRYKLKAETLFLAVELFDRFVVVRPVVAKDAPLVAGAVLLIASKFEEIDPPEVRDIVFAADVKFAREELIFMESVVLSTLGFKVCCPTVTNFLEHHRRAVECTHSQRQLLQYAAELSLLSPQVCRYPPSHVAAAALLVTNRLCRQAPAWSEALDRHTGWTEHALNPCAEEMRLLMTRAEASRFQAVRRKFVNSDNGRTVDFASAAQ